ncbi:hypothetical protein [Methanoculleus oceani]|uniref:Uncharacterized protein n=1 Tax=Methanoculleus oceani TaxID=2184756 RepID=A0ABD4TCD4_9EURY|nr:hypothetical protein [Methanoculleus sp. CWC-02]MCM2465646.1 hypothetical protein [Methanoculleus sp. CWC-02]
MAVPERDPAFVRYAREAGALARGVEDEIAREEQRQSALLACDGQLHVTGLFILAAVLANLIFLLFLPRYMLYWIAASFILYMANPFILMIPTGGLKTTLQDTKAVREFFSSLRGPGRVPFLVAGDARTFWKVFWDTFFINCQPLAAGFGLIFGINVFFALFSGYVAGFFEPETAALITLQSLAIILFYTGIWYVRPYTKSFFLSLDVMRMSMQEKVRAGWRATMRVVLLVAALAAASGAIAISAMLLPGMTLSTFLASVDLALGWNLLPLALIFASQVVIVRYLQGAYSRELFLQVGDYKVHVWRDGILRRLAASPTTPEEIPTPGHLADLMADLTQMQSDHRRMKVYTSEYHSLFGFFPVYLVLPDVRLILDRDHDAPRKSGPEPGGQVRTEPTDRPTGYM